MPITASEIDFRLSGGGGNSDPNAALGGAISSTAVSGSLNGLFDRVTGAEAAAGDIEYRCIYVKNSHGSLTLYSLVTWLSANTPSADTSIDIGLGTSAVNGTEQTVANEGTAPSGVSFSAPASFGAGLSIGDVPFGQHKAIWLRRTINAGAAAYNNDTFTLNVQGETAA